MLRHRQSPLHMLPDHRGSHTEGAARLRRLCVTAGWECLSTTYEYQKKSDKNAQYTLD